MATDILDDGPELSRMLDLSFSLYESLADLMDDGTLLVSSRDRIDIDSHRYRISIAAMNCLGDIELLLPMFTYLASIRSRERDGHA